MSPSITRWLIARMVTRSDIARFWMNANAAFSFSAELVHQLALGPVDDLAGLELLLEARGLVVQRPDLLEPAQRHLDRGHELAALERLDQVGERPGVAGLLDEVALAEGGEDQDRGAALARDLAGRGEPVETRHLDVEDGEVGLELAHELDRLVATTRLADDLVALLLEGLLQVEADDGLVLGDDDACCQGRSFRSP